MPKADSPVMKVARPPSAFDPMDYSAAKEGVRVFRSIREALNAGFQVYERSSEGYLVRMRTPQGWMSAIVDLRTAR